MLTKMHQHLFLDHPVLITVGPNQLEVIAVLPALDAPDVDDAPFSVGTYFQYPQSSNSQYTVQVKIEVTDCLTSLVPCQRP